MANDAPTQVSLDIQAIYELLPHRYPFLMVDRIEEISGDDFAVGIKNVTINEPYFAGHFPSKPIMPGVLLIEGMAQTAGAICILTRDRESPDVVYFMTIDQAKFRQPVFPGDTVRYQVRKIRNRSNIWKFDCQALVGDTKVAEARISALIADN
ncbi:3-hydroxyacyl-ACP dehydratase FabZ [Bauldia sp.]|uniref:3-hydroxyacyl-ACP dehydratase FabZ n=1 Tax=Bauldia sp. TaxID=2575872 RepID=UPI003BAC544D